MNKFLVSMLLCVGLSGCITMAVNNKDVAAANAVCNMKQAGTIISVEDTVLGTKSVRCQDGSRFTLPKEL